MRIFALTWSLLVSLLVLLLHVALMRRDPMWGLLALGGGMLMQLRWRSPMPLSGFPQTRNVL